jgi:glycerol-3-phosphate dehydrogenase
VLLCERVYLAQGTSSRSGKLVHGGLRYLEYYEFRLVREALIEREVLLRAAPHIIWPMRFVLPHSPEQRPAWLVRLGLFLYDHLGGRKILPATRAIDLPRDPVGNPLKSEFTKAFEYSDCWVDDARLVVLNALDAEKRGAKILTRTEVIGGRRSGATWEVTLRDRRSNQETTVAAGCIVNAAGPWVEQALQGFAGTTSSRRIRLVKGSHLVTRKFWQGDQAYLLQNDDKRVIFVNPYEGDLALIGTTDIAVEGRPEDEKIDDREIDYLLGVLKRYFVAPPGRHEIVHAFSGVRPLYDDNAESPSAVTRDYIFDIDPKEPSETNAPILSVFGGKITTYRKLAEHGLDRLRPTFPKMGNAWTAGASLPGGEIPGADFEGWLDGFRSRNEFLSEDLARHYGRLYGTRADALLDGARSLADLGRHFGSLLYQREVDFLRRQEWAIDAEDILERRTKHGLHLTPDQRGAFAAWLGGEAAPRARLSN